MLFRSVSVFLSFFAGLIAMARFSHQERRWRSLVLNLFGAAVVAFTLVVNLARVTPIVSIAATLIIAAILHFMWVRNGRPPGIREVEVASERQP